MRSIFRWYQWYPHIYNSDLNNWVWKLYFSKRFDSNNSHFLFLFYFFAVNGYKEVAFHVQRDVSSYTRSYIHHVIKTVAVIIECKEEDILFNGVRHSERFMLSLSVKEVYSGKLLALREKDRTKLRRLNIAYLIIDGESIHIERSKGK